MPSEAQPFNGNYIGADGQLHNLDGEMGTTTERLAASMTPFNGVFINSPGELQGLETVLTGASGSGLNLPEGGVDGQALIKNGDTFTWGDVVTTENISSIQNTISALNTDVIPEGGANKYYDSDKVDQAIEVNDSIMIKASYAINAPAGKVDASVKADKLSSVKNISLTGDISGIISTDLSENIIIPTVLTNAGTAGTYIKVTTDAHGRVVSGTQLAVDDVPDLPLSKVVGVGTAAVKSVGLGADQVPTLDANGKLPSSVLPPLNVSTAAPTPVESVDELITLIDAMPGTKALLPNTVVYMLVDSDPTNPDNWAELTEDPDTVKQINGKSGLSVNISTTNIEEGTNLYFTNERANVRADSRIAASTLSNLSGGASVQAAINANTTGIQSIKSVNGIPKSNGTAVTAAVAGTDYAKPVMQIATTLAVATHQLKQTR